MSEFMQYSEEWKQEIKKLPKTTIVEIASQMGIEKQGEINALKSQKNELLSVLKGLIVDVGGLLSDYDIEWQQAGYYETAKELIDKISK